MAENRFKYFVLMQIFAVFLFGSVFVSSAQQDDSIEVALDVNSSPVTSLPKIFKPGIDISGRGFHREPTWPQGLAAKEVLDKWQKEIGFEGVYRLPYSLWEISQLSKNAELQNKLIATYDEVIKRISDSGGTVIVNVFGMPAGLGKILDRRSPPQDFREFKKFVKKTISELSCNKKYNVWYEVWNAPDLDDFFLGRKQDYLYLYRSIAEAVKELERQNKIHIPVGGPSISGWFQNINGNNVLTPEKSLVYELIKYCYRYHLPLDFISWHVYSTATSPEKDETIYKKTIISLTRDWLSYFKFKKETPLIIDEWNYDKSINVLPERKEKSFVAASYIPSRIKGMYESGIDYQAYYCLEDFQHNKEGITRNVGVFSFDPEYVEYKGTPKATYNVFRMLSKLGKEMFLLKTQDDFAGVIVTKSPEEIAILAYNYSDQDLVTNYLSKNIAYLAGSERRFLLDIIKTGDVDKIMSGDIEISKLRMTKRVKNFLRKAQELNSREKKFETTPRNIKLQIKGLKGNYLYEKYVVDSSCAQNCKFAPQEDKELPMLQSFQETLVLKPYSVQLILLKNKPPDPEPEVKEAVKEPVKESIPEAKEVSAVKQKQ
ncbi:MAG: cellulase family glycosylhydrolase [Candidatus Omnitrophica bacterium]|nr:cellulase family glycosylhydrolase [Candidatus Omnitrophota bacterium]